MTDRTDLAHLAGSALFSVQGKVALVTGGATGIGLMISKGLVANGCTVYISSRKADNCERAAQELTAAGPGRAFALPCDLSKGDATVRQLAATLAEREDKLHILVNNSGVTWGDTLEAYPEAAWDRCFTVNVKALFEVTRACLPLLKKGSGGNRDPAKVINIGSVAGVTASYDGATFAPAYAASKAAVDQLTRHLAAQFLDDAITVNCIGPALFPSGMTKYALGSEEIREMAAHHHPVGRYGCEEDMAGTALFLASPASSFINGSTLYLDGGSVHIRGSAHL